MPENRQRRPIPNPDRDMLLAMPRNHVGGNSLLVEEVENFYGAFEDWGSSVHNYPERALFSLLKIRMKTSKR